MQRSEFSPERNGEPSSGRPVAGRVRFRTESEPVADTSQRRWQAVYSEGDSWIRFQISIDLGGGTCTFRRAPDADYSTLLRQLSGAAQGSATALPAPAARVDSLSFDIDIVGLKMAGVTAAAGPRGGSGDWLVVQLYLPGSTDSFLLGVSNHLAAGEIVIPRADTAPAVLGVLSQVFG